MPKPGPESAQYAPQPSTKDAPSSNEPVSNNYGPRYRSSSSEDISTREEAWYTNFSDTLYKDLLTPTQITGESDWMGTLHRNKGEGSEEIYNRKLAERMNKWMKQRETSFNQAGILREHWKIEHPGRKPIFYSADKDTSNGHSTAVKK